MTEHNDARSTSMVPILNVSDSRAAPDFYRDQLEFEIRWEWAPTRARIMWAMELTSRA